MKKYQKPSLVVELIEVEDVILQSGITGILTDEGNHTVDTDINITFGGN